MVAQLRRFLAEEEGATMVEYALMIALIAAASMAVITNLKTSMSGKFTAVSTAVGGS